MILSDQALNLVSQFYSGIWLEWRDRGGHKNPGLAAVLMQVPGLDCPVLSVQPIELAQAFLNLPEQALELAEPGGFGRLPWCYCFVRLETGQVEFGRVDMTLQVQEA